MDKELINTALKEVIETTASAKDFVLEQAPEVAQQLIAYEIAANLTATIIGVILLGCAIYLATLVIREARKEEYEMNVPLILFGVIGTVVCFLFGILGFSDSVYNLLKVTLAPKLFLLEYARGLV